VSKTLFRVLLGLMGFGIAAIVMVNVFEEEPAPKAAPVVVATPALSPTLAAAPVAWLTYKDDDLHFFFESPITLEVNKPPAGLQVKTVDMQGQSVRGDLYIRVQAQETKYELDLKSEMDRQVETLKSMGEALRNLQVTTNPVTIWDAPGLLAEGTAHLPGRTPWEMKLLKIKKGSTLLDMFIQFSPEGEGKATANRVLQSLSFSN
jgi:hypothetical protein